MMDCSLNHELFSDFLKWHEDNKVHLLQVDGFRAEEFRREHGLRSVEVGLWYEKYSLEFQRDPDESKGTIRLYFSRNGEEYYKKCVKYIESLKIHGQLISGICKDIIKNPPVNNDPLDKILSEHWPEYVDCQKRMEKEGIFLREIFRLMQHKPKNDVHILDAAARIGCETIFLFNEGYRVTSNEIDVELTNILFNSLSQEQRRKIEITTHNWVQMSLKFGNNKFDGVLVLGNSLCLIHDDNVRALCLKQFYNVLKPGGILVIDQRNFEKILANVPPVLDLNYFYNNNFYSGEYMYCGKKVKGWPT
jgi:hypothetical protein